MPKAINGMKVCSHCRVNQSTTQFCKHNSTPDKLQSQCRRCSNEASKESQGMKRAEKAELKELLAAGDLGFRLAIVEAKKRYKKVIMDIYIQHGRSLAKATVDFAWGEDHGKIIGKESQRPA